MPEYDVEVHLASNRDRVPAFVGAGQSIDPSALTGMFMKRLIDCGTTTDGKPKPAMTVSRFSWQDACQPCTPSCSKRAGSQGAMSMSWIPGLASSTRVRMGRRKLLRNCCPGRGNSRSTAARVWWALWYSPPSWALKAKGRRPASLEIDDAHVTGGDTDAMTACRHTMRSRTARLSLSP
jgi:hypothetical protein